MNEARRLNIPCIGVVDTNCDPDTVSFPIPGNDDAIRAVSLFCSIMADAVIEGRAQNEKFVQQPVGKDIRAAADAEAEDAAEAVSDDESEDADSDEREDAEE